MGAIINVRIPATAVELGETAASLPGLTVEAERLVDRPGDDPFSLLWLHADDLAAVEEALESDSTVAEFGLVGEFEDRGLYRIRWAEADGPTIRTLGAAGGYVRDATLTDGEWITEVLFADRADLSRMYDAVSDDDLPLTVDSIHGLGVDGERAAGLTDDQRETLVAALEHGYYDVPRSISLVDLAAKLGISHQALSERLRRAHETLVDAFLNGHAADTPEAYRSVDE